MTDKQRIAKLMNSPVPRIKLSDGLIIDLKRDEGIVEWVLHQKKGEIRDSRIQELIGYATGFEMLGEIQDLKSVRVVTLIKKEG